MSGQSTDAANSAPLITAKSAGGDAVSSTSRSTQDIAKDPGESTGGDGNGEVVTAPIPGNA
jgi:hypothetical protein